MRARRVARAVTAGLLALGLVVVAAGDGGRDPVTPDRGTGETRAAGHRFVTRPDLSPPVIEVSTGPAGPAPLSDDDLFLLAPKGNGTPMTGLLIVDSRGEPVWVRPLPGLSYDLRVQEYRDRPVLTWWRGEQEQEGYGEGEFVILDASYQEIGTVTTGGTTRADFHELTLTSAGTALLVSYRTVARDLTAVGGPREGYVLDGVVQEVDVATGEVLFEWRALDHVPLTDTLVDLAEADDQDGTADAPLDYVHVNSVTEDGDRALLVSARNTHAVYRIDRDTGEVDWTLGGSGSDFRMADGASFAWQHDAQRQPDGTISLFDNQSPPSPRDSSRGLRLALDHEAGVASVAREYPPPDGRRAAHQGNLQVRETGNVVIGWGAEPYYSEYTFEGELILDADFGAGHNYRAYRLPWRATPDTGPSLVVTRGGDGPVARVSWNGATEVAAWRFLAGGDADDAEAVTTVPRGGFETAAPVPDRPYVAVQALDTSGRVLATADTTAAPGRPGSPVLTDRGSGPAG